MESLDTKKSTRYQVRVKGATSGSVGAFLDGITTVLGEGEMLLVGDFVDQAALRGLVDHLWNLNFTILSIETIQDEEDQRNLPTKAERYQA